MPASQKIDETFTGRTTNRAGRGFLRPNKKLIKTSGVPLDNLYKTSQRRYLRMFWLTPNLLPVRAKLELSEEASKNNKMHRWRQYSRRREPVNLVIVLRLCSNEDRL